MHPAQGKAKSLGVLALIGILGTCYYQYSKAPTPAKPIAITLPAGTAVTVRLDHTIGSKTSTSGQAFAGKLTEAIVVDGKTAVPVDTEFSGKVVEASAAGHLAGGASLKIALASFELDGTEYQVQTSTVSRVSQGKGKRTAEMAGGGAAVGALVGAMAHGVKGALVGAAVGAGAGAATSAATSNARDIVMPAQSSVTFKLTQPLTVSVSQDAKTPTSSPTSHS